MIQISEELHLSYETLADFEQLTIQARNVGVVPQQVILRRLQEMNVNLENSLLILDKLFGGGSSAGVFTCSPSLYRGLRSKPGVHTQVDYVHYLVPDLLQVTNSSFYYGNIDRYRAEELLSQKPEGTFLLRDSAHTDHLFSVSFRRYGKSLHARIEQSQHSFCFDAHEHGVFTSRTVCGLLEHYKEPSQCRYFEPMLTRPLPRAFPFSLSTLCRAAICHTTSYDGISSLALPRPLRDYLKEYHYKQLVCVRSLDY